MPSLLSWCSRAGGGGGAVGWSGCLSVCVRRAGRPTPHAGLPRHLFSACQYHCPTYPHTYKHTCSGLAASTVEAPQPMLGRRSEPTQLASSNRLPTRPLRLKSAQDPSSRMPRRRRGRQRCVRQRSPTGLVPRTRPAACKRRRPHPQLVRSYIVFKQYEAVGKGGLISPENCATLCFR